MANKKNSINWLDYIIQFLFIFSSVFFAFWLTNYNQERGLKKLERKAIGGVYLELKQNLEAMESNMLYHKEIRDQLFAYADSLMKGQIDIKGKSTMEHVFSILNRQNSAFAMPNLKSTAYEIYLSSDAHMLTDFEVANSLANTYNMQHLGIQNTITVMTDRIYSDVRFYDPEYTMPYIQLIKMTYRELYGHEIFLSNKIKEVMNRIEVNYPQVAMNTSEQ